MIKRAFQPVVGPKTVGLSGSEFGLGVEASPTPLESCPGNRETAFAPGETIQFAAQVNKSYGGILLAVNDAADYHH
jgi:hypothetical protein